MGEIVDFTGSHRAVPEIEDHPAEGTTINLDAIGRMGPLICQVAALSKIEELPIGTSALVIRNGARKRFVGDEAGELTNLLMDEKDELRYDLGGDGLRMVRDCLTALSRVYEDAGWRFG